MKLPSSDWPKNDTSPSGDQEENAELNTTLCNLAVVKEPLMPVNRFSSFNFYKRVTAWVLRFIHNCRTKIKESQPNSGHLSTQELTLAANYWYSVIQEAHFPSELRALRMKSQVIPTSSKLCSLNPMIDEHGILRVGDRQQKSQFSYNSKHPVILDSKHPLCKLMI